MRKGDVFKFGKYKNHEIEDVIEDDPKYIAWCYENNVVLFDEEIIEILEKKKII